MPAAVAKGIILSVSIITALGLAVLENPQIQQWLEEQRRKIAELLRQIGEDLDPQSRRAAEAFAYEGRTVANDDSLRREASGSKEAAEVATGRSLSNASTVRRIPIQGPTNPDDAEERRRKGREYLARRNQQMYELQQKRKAAKAEGMETPPTPTFDSLVDDDGNLKTPVVQEKELPSPPAMEPLPEPVIAEQMKEVERNLSQPLLVGESTSHGMSGWLSGSAFANPFGDEYAVERSITPKPPVPPKIELNRPETPPISIPGSFSPIPTEPQPVQEPTNHEGLSYEEQLAIALSLSEQDNPANAATVRQSQPEEDDDLQAAIAASLKDMDDQQAAHAIAHADPATPQPMAIDAQPLVDLTPAEPSAIRPPRGNWATLFDPQYSPSREPLTLAPPATAPSEASDELYRLTPELTRARLATFDAQQATEHAHAPSSTGGSSLPFDPVRDAVRTGSQDYPDLMDASFHSAVDVASPSARSMTLVHEVPQLIEIDEEPSREGARTPTSRAHSSFRFESDSDSDTFASISAPASRAQSRPRSEISNVEVIDVVEDSDVDMLSEEGDGIATPDTWSEVGSRDADSDTEDDLRQQSRASL